MIGPAAGYEHPVAWVRARQIACTCAVPSCVIASVSSACATVRRLSRLTAHPIGMPSAGPNSTSLSVPRIVRVTSATPLRSRGSASFAGENYDGATAFLLKLKPADRAAGYHASSRIASRAFCSAQASCAGSAFSARAQCCRRSRGLCLVVGTRRVRVPRPRVRHPQDHVARGVDQARPARPHLAGQPRRRARLFRRRPHQARPPGGAACLASSLPPSTLAAGGGSR